MSPPTTPNRAIKRKEADTIQKTRFFEAFDSRTCSKESLRSLAAKFDITFQTACNWLKKRQIQGSPAYRRSRKLSKRLGRRPKLTNDQIQHLLSSLNPTRNQHYSHQIQYFDLACGVSTLLKKPTKTYD